MSATVITTDIDICNMALYRMGAAPITAFTDTTDEAKIARATYIPILYALQEEFSWNFLSGFRTLAAGQKDAASFGYDYAYDLVGDEARIDLVEDQANTDGQTWEIVGDKLYTDLLHEGERQSWVTITSNFIQLTGHGYVEDQPVRVLDNPESELSGAGLATGTTYYVVYNGANSFGLSASTASGNILSGTTTYSSSFKIFSYGLNVKYGRYSTTVSEFTAQFIDTLASRLEAEWSERLVKSAAMGERKDAMHERKYQRNRSTDGQQSTPTARGEFSTKRAR